VRAAGSALANGWWGGIIVRGDSSVDPEGEVRMMQGEGQAALLATKWRGFEMSKREGKPGPVFLLLLWGTIGSLGSNRVPRAQVEF
jgi:hypothetical protein